MVLLLSPSVFFLSASASLISCIEIRMSVLSGDFMFVEGCQR